MSFSRKFTAGVALVISSVCCAHEWQTTDGPDGGEVRLLEQVGQTLFAAGRPSVQRSTDFGRTWRFAMRSESGDDISAIGGAGSVVLVGDGGGNLKRSTDAGETWQRMVSPQPGEAITFVTIENGRYLAVTQPLTLNGLQPGSLWASDDEGESWQFVPTPRQVGPFVFVEGDTIMTQTFELFTTLMRSFDGGKTWDEVDRFFSIGNNIIRHSGSLYMYEDLLLRSDDEGETWETVPTQGLNQQGTLQPEALVSDGETLYIAKYPGFWYSVDDGFNWTEQSAGLPLGSMQTTVGVMVAEDRVVLAGRYGVYAAQRDFQWTRSERGLGISSIYAMTTTDGALIANVINTPRADRLAGGEWQEVLINPAQGLHVTLALWTAGDGALFAGTQVDGIFRSLDGGLTWHTVNAGVPSYNGTAGLQFHEVEAFTHYNGAILAGTGRGLEQRPGQQGFQTIGGGILRSTNGGQSWQSFSTGLPIVATGPFFEQRPDPVISLIDVGDAAVAGLWFNGMYRRDGARWVEANDGFPMTAPGLPAVANDLERVGDTVYAALSFSGGVGVVKTEDAGRTWEPATAGLPQAVVNAIVWHNGTLYAALWGSTTRTDDGVWASDDGGQSWRRAGSGLDGVPVRRLAVRDNVLYAGSIHQAVWQLAIGPTPGDTNCDGAIDAFDIQPFILALTDPQGYAVMFPECDIDSADANADGRIDAFDIEPFVNLLVGP